MKKIFLGFFVFATFAFAELRHVEVTEDFVKSGIKIIDIRTSSEWKDTGIIENSIPITFFDEQGHYNADAFLEQLNKHVKKDREFALICRTGNRTVAVSDFLSKNGYKVVNLKGGIVKLLKQGYVPEKYQP